VGVADVQKFQKFEVLTGSSIRVQPTVGQVSFGNPGLVKCVDVFLTMLLAFQATPSEGPPSRSRLDLLRLDLHQNGLNDGLNDDRCLD